MKIVFIPNLPYTYRDHQRFGVEYFYNKGYDVEVLDIHNIIMPNYKDKVKIDYFTFEFHSEPKDSKDALDKIKDLTSDDFVFYYTGSKEGIALLHKMKEVTKAKFMTYVAGTIPTSIVSCDLLVNTKLILKRFIKRFIKKVIFPADYVVSASPINEQIASMYIDKDTKIIESNSSDYNLCLTVEGYKTIKPYCVFLDTDVIDASDYELDDYKTEKLDIESYMKKISIFFKWIEINYNLEVIIAAHPKSRLYLGKDNYQGIKVMHGKSASLVKNAEFVINEGTTAISYAILFNKPLIFFTAKEISFFKHTCVFAKVLNKKIINIDILSDQKYSMFEEELKNNKMYTQYKYNYLTYSDNKINTFNQLEESVFKK